MIRDKLPSPNWKKWRNRLLGAVATIFTIAIIYLLFLVFGAEAIIYIFVFILGAAGIPALIMLFSPSFPKFLRETLGDVNWILGSMTNGHTWLVQRSTGEWETQPGRRKNGVYQVWIDGAWYDIKDGAEKITRLGWKPFGILLEKDPLRTLQDVRADTKARTTGSEITDRQRGEYEDKGAPSDPEDTWLVDMVRARWPLKSGRTELIERAEMQELKKQAGKSLNVGWHTVAGAVFALIFGALLAIILHGL